jgi:hypothetical protein
VRTLALLIACACGAHAHEPTDPPPAKSADLNHDGGLVDVEAAVMPGYVTVVDFWSESCGACGVVGGLLAVGIAYEPHVLVRKVDVGDGFTPVAQAYKIGALPHFNVYDRQRRLRYVLVGNDCVKAPEIAKQLLAEPMK